MKNEIRFIISYSEDYFKSSHYSISVKSYNPRFYPDGTITLIIKNGLKANQNDVEKSIEDVKKELIGYINEGLSLKWLHGFQYKF